MTIPKAESVDEGGDDDSGDDGTLSMDATCCPADIAYPQDLNLLNDVREKLEASIDEIYREQGLSKLRMYREKARKDYLRLAKEQHGKAVSKGHRRPLWYIRRDVGYIVKFVQNGVRISPAQRDQLNLITSFLKHFTSRGANLLRSIIVKDNIHDSGCSLKIYRRNALRG